MLSQKLFLPLIIVILCSNCNAKSYGESEYKAFEMKLFQTVAEATPANVIIAPVSQKILLTMIMEGAVNETEIEIRKSLKMSGNETTDRNFVRSLTYSIPGKDSVVATVNRIFLDKAYQINEDYRKILQLNYSADVESINKDNPTETVEAINRWVENGTSGLVPSIVEESDISRNLILMLGNVLYFKAKWLMQFDERDTKKDCFYRNGDECVMQEMMWMQEERFSCVYFEELDADLIDLPYENFRHSMIIILPKQRNGIDQLIAKLHNYSMLDFAYKLLKAPYDYLKVLKIPKFTAEYEINMVEIFKSLNIKRAFNPAAQLGKMVVNAGRPVWFSKILHKSKIIVNEAGSEAAAVSLGSLTLFSKKNGQVSFIADHPFIYFIKDNDNNVLFAGKYTGP